MCRRTLFLVLVLGASLVSGALALAAPPAATADAKADKIKDLLKQRLATLQDLVRVATAEYREGRGSFDRLQQATRAVLDAELELCETDKERVNVLEKLVAVARESEKSAVQRIQTGLATPSDALMATAARLEAEIALERAKSKVPAPAKQPTPGR